MQTCTIDEVRFVQCNNVTLKCLTPYSSTNGGDYAHMLEFFMVVDFPNGQGLNNNQNIGIYKFNIFIIQISSGSSLFTYFACTFLTYSMIKDEISIFAIFIHKDYKFIVQNYIIDSFLILNC